VVSNHMSQDIKDIMRLLLDSIGYSSFVDTKLSFFLGSGCSIDYFPDLIIVKKSDDPVDGKLIAINIIRPNKYHTPSGLKEWMENKGIRIIELSSTAALLPERDTVKTDTVKTIDISGNDTQTLVEEFLTFLGYVFEKDNKLNIAGHKEYSFDLMADLLIRSDGRTKIIEYAEISKYTKRYAKSRGVDIVTIDSLERRDKILMKIIKLLSADYKGNTEVVSSYITPKGVRYRLLIPGILTKPKNGDGFLFFTDHRMNELLEPLIDKRVTLIRF
ncbi:MAG: hypothetical protein HY754_11435, partial [Nitrospirae bacterium]|nr:hypothetical protein [Nitrospirota bacterium]